MLFELTDTALKVDSPRWLEIYKLSDPTESPVVNGGTVIFFGAVSQKVIDRPRTPIDPGTLADPPRDDAAWDDFINDRITESEWRQRQEAFGGSNGFGYILDDIGGNKVFETDRNRYDRILAGLDGDVSQMPSRYWLNEQSHYEPHYYEWKGVCTSNGGNWRELEGNVIEIEVNPETVMYVRALVGESEIYQEFSVVNGVVAEDECDMTAIGGNREDIHSSPTGPNRPQKPKVSPAWESGNKVAMPKLFLPKDQA